MSESKIEKPQTIATKIRKELKIDTYLVTVRRLLMRNMFALMNMSKWIQ